MRAAISNEQYNKFKEYTSNKDTIRVLNDKMKEAYYGMWNDPAVKAIHESFEQMFHLSFYANSNRYEQDNDKFNEMDVLIQFSESKNRPWEVTEIGSYWLITFSGHSYFYLPAYATVIEEPDYENMSIADMRKMLSLEENENLSFLPDTVSSLTVSDVRQDMSELDSKKMELDKIKEDIRNNKEASLAAMEEELNKLKEKLSSRKQELLAEMEEKLAELNAKRNEMVKEITILESEIYTIRSYSGETMELTKVRSGKTADSSTPVIVNQKMLYLDEDLARIVSVYQEEISRKFSRFEEALTYSEEVFEAFCPQERCVTFFRLSKNATYKWYNENRNMYETETLLHGKKIGFVLRDGENAFIGWLDESWGKTLDGEDRLVSFSDNLFHKPEEDAVINDVDDADRLSSDSSNTMVSRVFAMAALQGVLDNEKIITFPQKVNVMKPSSYIKYNYADSWLMDDRFGDFETLTSNLRKYTREKDTILLIFNVHGSGRSVGDSDRTYDCYLEEGVYEINMIKDGTVYVRAKRDCHKTCSNVGVSKNEIINISYMNSIWLKYYIQTKKLGRYSHDYAKVVKHFKRALEVIEAREAEEMSAIKEFYSEADQVPEWQLKLSNWKIKNGIRRITEFQAKRVATYLRDGKFYEMANLFEKGPLNDFSINKIYSLTKLQKSANSYVYQANTTNIEFGTGYGTDYGKTYDSFFFPNKYHYANESFYSTSYDEHWSDTEKEKQEKAEKRRTVYEEIYSRVPARIKKDEKKLDLIRTEVSTWLLGHNITAEEIAENDVHERIFGDHFIACAEHLGYVRSCDLTEEQISVIKSGHIYGIDTNYANVYTCDGPLWPLYYHNHLQECYEKILTISRKILHDRWMKEVREI